MGLNIAGLRKQKEKDLATGSGKDGYLSTKQISEDPDNPTTVKLAPPSLSMGGIPYVKVIRYWLDKKPYISPETFGKKCPIKHELDKAIAGNNADAKALAVDPKRTKRKEEFWMPLFLLKPILNKHEDVVGVEVVGERCKIFQAGKMMADAITTVMISRQYVNRSADDGICDRKTGAFILLSKTGTGLNTKYTAEGWMPDGNVVEIDAKYYVDMPDPVELAKDQIKSAKYLQAVTRQYLYGEEIPEVLEVAEKARVEAVKSKYQTKKANAAAAAASVDSPVATPKAKTTATKPKAAAPAPDDDYEADESFQRSAKTAKPPVKKAETIDPEDEFDDTDPIDEALARGKAQKEAATKAAPRNIMKDTIAAANTEEDDLDAEIEDFDGDDETLTFDDDDFN